MKFARPTLMTLAIVALLAGCGKSKDLTTAPETSPTLDDTAPPSPQGLTVLIDPLLPGGTLTWTASSAPDVAKYQVFEYSPDPNRENAYQITHDTESAVPGWTLPVATHPTSKYFRVRAVDQSGNPSGMSRVIRVSLWPDARKKDPGPGSQPFDN